jgi:hypothetical protein
VLKKLKARYTNVAYTIAEISVLIKLSKVSIYKKLKLPELKDHTTKKQGITYIDDVGFNIIKGSFNINDDVNLNNNVKKVPDNINENNVIDDYVATDTEGFNLNEELFNMLKEQLKEKDNQLNVKDNQLDAKDKQLAEANERLKQAHRLIENNQVLLKDKPQQSILQIEEHFQELDTKLEEVKNKMSDRKEQQEHRSIFNKLFR